MNRIYTRHFAHIPARDRYWRVIAITLTAIVLIAWLLRLTLRDRVLGLATVYYAVPPQVGVLLSLLAAALWLRFRRWLPGVGLFALAMLQAGWMYISARAPQIDVPVPASALRIRVLLWNVSSAGFGLEHVERMVRDSRADIAAFVEARKPGEWMENWWRTTFPEYRYHGFGDGLVVLSKFESVQSGFEPMGDLGRRATVRLRLPDQRELTLALVDIQHYVFSSRGAALRALLEWAAPRSDQPLVVLGDFNTPPDSVHFDRLREHLNPAWEVPRNGYSSTWPSFFPVLTLDQIWVSAPIRVISIEKRGTIVSDHLPLVAELALVSAVSP